MTQFSFTMALQTCRRNENRQSCDILLSVCVEHVQHASLRTTESPLCEDVSCSSMFRSLIYDWCPDARSSMSRVSEKRTRNLGAAWEELLGLRCMLLKIL